MPDVFFPLSGSSVIYAGALWDFFVPGLARLPAGRSLDLRLLVDDNAVKGFGLSALSVVSDTPAVVSVSDGVLCAVSPGSATATLLGFDAAGAEVLSVDFNVLVDPVPVTGVSLSETTRSLAVGESFDLVATVSPDEATNKNVTWTSNDESVATVDENGTVKALKTGKTTITVTTEDGDHAATCEVTVTEAANPTPPVDRSSWGTPYVRETDGVTQYVVEDPTSPDYGMTSVELDPELASAHDATSLTYWVRESSGSPSAWYGLTAHISTCHPGYRFYVQWLSPGDPGYDALLAQLDDAAKQRIEDDNGWIFNMGIRDPDGNDLHYITAPNGFSYPPSVYVQIGDDWDADDLNAYYIAAGGDENVPVDYLMLDYPAGTDTFGRMTLEHFSPYIIFDELTDAEKATLGNGNPTTGDHAAQMAISGLGMVLVLALGIMLRLITGKKKFSE